MHYDQSPSLVATAASLSLECSGREGRRESLAAWERGGRGRGLLAGGGRGAGGPEVGGAGGASREPPLRSRSTRRAMCLFSR